MAEPKKPTVIPVVTYKSRRVVPHFVGGIPADGGSCPKLAPEYEYSPVWFDPAEYNPSTSSGRTKPFPTEWVHAPQWTGLISACRCVGGRSSSCFEVLIALAPDLPVVGLMAYTEFFQLLPHLVNGSARGTFRAVKRGQNYMIEVVNV